MRPIRITCLVRQKKRRSRLALLTTLQAQERGRTFLPGNPRGGRSIPIPCIREPHETTVLDTTSPYGDHGSPSLRPPVFPEHIGSKRAERRGQRAQAVRSLAGLPLQKGEQVSHLGRADLVAETFRHERESHRRQIRDTLALHCILDPFTPAKRHAAGRLSR